MSNNSYDIVSSQFTQKKATHILNKYPNKRPVVIWDINNNMFIKKRKFIVDENLTLGQLLFVIRKRCDLNQSEALFIFIIYPENTYTLPILGKTIGEVYGTSSIDGFLRIIISKEETFG